MDKTAQQQAAQQQTAILKSLFLSSAEITRQLDNSLGAIHGIGLTEFMVLQSLSAAHNGSLRRIDIAESLGRTASGVTRMLMPMEKIGLVEKASSSRDARVSMVKISEAGERILDEANKSFEQKSAQILADLSDEQQTFLLESLQLLPGG